MLIYFLTQIVPQVHGHGHFSCEFTISRSLVLEIWMWIVWTGQKMTLILSRNLQCPVFLYPRSTEGGMGVYWIHPDICPSVRPSVDKVSGTFWRKLLAQFISYLTFNPYGGSLLTSIHFRVPGLIFGPLVAKYLAENGVSGTFWKTIGPIHFIPGIYPYGVSLLTPIHFRVPRLIFSPLVAKYTTGKKICNIFCIIDFLHFCGLCRVFLYLRYIPTSRYYFWGSWLALNSKMMRKGSKTIISVFFSIRLWLEFLLSLYQIAAISIRVLYRDIVLNTIVYLSSILVRSAGDQHHGGLA